jgi:hypothetical protein
LARHANAVTLLHIVKTRHSINFPFECKKCRLFFSSEEFLDSHHKNSSCNPQMVWPPGAGHASGLRCVPRSSIKSSKSNKDKANAALSVGEKRSRDALSFSYDKEGDDDDDDDKEEQDAIDVDVGTLRAGSAKYIAHRTNKNMKVLVPEGCFIY